MPEFASFSVDTNVASRTDMNPGETYQKRDRDSHSEEMALGLKLVRMSTRQKREKNINSNYLISYLTDNSLLKYLKLVNS